jgi:hypothetical protein
MPNFRTGWRDKLDGKDYPRDYDVWNYRGQVAYEEGRRVAAIVQGAYPNLATRRPNPKKFPALLRVDAMDERAVTRRRR